MRILIIAYYFPPEDRATMAAQRPYSWAKYWSRMGHEVCILTNKKVDASSNSISPPSCHHSKAAWVEEVQYLPFKLYQKETSETSNNVNLILQIKKFLLLLKEKLGTGTLLYASNLWIFPAIRKIKKIYSQWQFDIVVSTFGPPATHIVAGFLKKQLNFFWVADYRDLWYGNDFQSAKLPFNWIEEKIEHRFISQANLITTVSSAFSDLFSSRFSIKTLTIENGFDLEEIPDENQEVITNTNKIRFAYTGTIYLGKRDPLSLFKAIVLLKEKEVLISSRLEILFYTWNVSILKSIVKNYGLDNIVKILDAVSREEALQIQRNVDALIFLDWNDPSVDGILTGKLFEYIYSGRPVIGIGASSQTAASRLIEEAGVGVSLGKSEQRIADYLEGLLKGEKIKYNPKPSVSARYNRKRLAEKMLEEIIKYRSISNAK